MSQGALDSDSLAVSSQSRAKRGVTVGTKGMYEVTSGASLTFSEPDATGTPLCAIKAGVRFHGVPYTFGNGHSRKEWIMLHTEDVPPPLLCFGKEAGLQVGKDSAERRAHNPKSGIAAMILTLGNPVVPRKFTARNMKDIQFVDTDKQFACAGSIAGVKFYVGYANIQYDLRIQVYRRVRDDIFRLITESPPIACPDSGVQTYMMPKPLIVSRGDYIGWSHNGAGMIAYDTGGNNVVWNIGRQGKGVNIDMKNSGSLTFSYEVMYNNHCEGHMLYKASAPAPLFHSPELDYAQVLWMKMDDKCVNRVRDLERAPKSADDDELGIEYCRSQSRSQSQLLPPISGGMSKMASISQSMNELNSPYSEWVKRGNGCWINYRRYGPRRDPPNDNCGRWRQLN